MVMMKVVALVFGDIAGTGTGGVVVAGLVVWL